MSDRLDMIALQAADEIENEFARGHSGGVTQRKAGVQVIVRAAIARAFDEATKGLLAARNPDSKSA